MGTYILIHGSFFGAWDKVVPLLEERGHEVIAPDLPGYGDDATPVGEITLQDYTDKAVEALDAAPEPAILVGHSRGGVVISQAAEERPEKVRTLVYLAAFMLPDGGSLFGFAQGRRRWRRACSTATS